MLGLFAILALAASGGAIAIDSKSAWVSILIGASGLLLGLVLALTLSDWIVRKSRRENWLRVRGQIAELIHRHVVRVAIEFERTLEDQQILAKRGWQPFSAFANPDTADPLVMGEALTGLVSRISDAAEDLGFRTFRVRGGLKLALAGSVGVL